MKYTLSSGKHKITWHVLTIFAFQGLHHEKEYIATQGPRPVTTDHFAQMVWDQNCTNIVMLTELTENGENSR